MKAHNVIYGEYLRLDILELEISDQLSSSFYETLDELISISEIAGIFFPLPSNGSEPWARAKDAQSGEGVNRQIILDDEDEVIDVSKKHDGIVRKEEEERIAKIKEEYESANIQLLANERSTMLVNTAVIISAVCLLFVAWWASLLLLFFYRTGIKGQRNSLNSAIKSAIEENEKEKEWRMKRRDAAREYVKMKEKKLELIEKFKTVEELNKIFIK